VELLAQAEQSGKIETAEVNAAGRVMANRSMGKISFIDLQDGSGKIQLFLGKNVLDEQSNALLKEIDIGDILGANGVVFRTRSGEPTIRTKTLTMLSKSLQPLPEKWHGLSDVEIRYRQRYLDLISNEEVRQTSARAAGLSARLEDIWMGRAFWKWRPRFSNRKRIMPRLNHLSPIIMCSTVTFSTYRDGITSKTADYRRF